MPAFMSHPSRRHNCDFIICHLHHIIDFVSAISAAFSGLLLICSQKVWIKLTTSFIISIAQTQAVISSLSISSPTLSATMMFTRAAFVLATQLSLQSPSQVFVKGHGYLEVSLVGQ